MTSSAQSRFKCIRNIATAIGIGAVLAGCQSMTAGIGLDADNTSYKRMVTQGEATKIINPNVYPDCPQHNPRMNIRKSAVGQITATDGTVITVPAETAAGKGLGPKSYDLYNECKQITPANTSEVSTANVPVVEIDADGDVITGYIVADNYYEMYVNGKLVSVDNTPYTPFNSAIVKFKAKRPYTLAFLLVDWEMAPMDGYTLVHHLRGVKSGVDARAAVIMMSANAEPARIMAARKLGVSHFILKPVVPHRLAERMQWALDHPIDYVEIDEQWVPREFAG